MATHIVTPITPPIIDDERFSSNGMVPSAALATRLAETFNFIGARAKKLVFCRAQPLYAVSYGSGGATEFWPLRFRTGENTTGLRILAGLALTDFGFVSAPEFSCSVKTEAAVTVASKTWKYSGFSSSATVLPTDIHHIHDTITGLSPGTAYQISNTVLNGGKLVYLAIAELESRHVNDATTAVCNPGEILPDGPIYDSHVQDLVEANNELWRHNGAQLISWAAPYDLNSAPQITATSYTAVTAAGGGFNLFTQYHNTVNRSTIPVRFAFYTRRASGVGTCSMKFTDGTNSLEITGMTGGWSTTTAGTIPPQNGTNWTLQAKVTSGTFEIYAACLYEWET